MYMCNESNYHLCYAADLHLLIDTRVFWFKRYVASLAKQLILSAFRSQIIWRKKQLLTIRRRDRAPVQRFWQKTCFTTSHKSNFLRVWTSAVSGKVSWKYSKEPSSRKLLLTVRETSWGSDRPKRGKLHIKKSIKNWL